MDEHNLIVASVLSGNRNFEGRVHAQVRASFLASPPLVVAYALAGTVDIDLTTEPLGWTQQPGRLPADIWPTQEEVREVGRVGGDAEVFSEELRQRLRGRRALADAAGARRATCTTGTRLDLRAGAAVLRQHVADADAADGHRDARVLLKLADSITTDHISPAGSISTRSAAGWLLIELGVEPARVQLSTARAATTR